MAKYRKKPVIIEAEQWWPGLQVNGVELVEPSRGAASGAYVNTLEGPLLAQPGDWIITGVRGERYPCKPDVFEATYELVLDDDACPAAAV